MGRLDVSGALRGAVVWCAGPLDSLGNPCLPLSGGDRDAAFAGVGEAARFLVCREICVALMFPVALGNSSPVFCVWWCGCAVVARVVLHRHCLDDASR